MELPALSPQGHAAPELPSARQDGADAPRQQTYLQGSGRSGFDATKASSRLSPLPPGSRDGSKRTHEDKGRVLAGRDNGSLALLAAKTGEELVQLHGHEDWILAVDVHWASMRALTSGGDQLFLWDLRRGAGDELKPTGGCLRALALDWSTDRAITGGDSGRLALWDLAGKRCQRIVDGRFSIIFALSVDWVKSRALVAHGELGLAVVDLQSGERVRELVGYASTIMVLSANWSAGRALCGAGDGHLCIWDIRHAQPDPELHLRGHRGAITALCADWSRKKGVSGSEDHQLRVWALKEGECVATLTRHTSPIRCLSIDWEAGKIASGSECGGLFLWSLSAKNHTEATELLEEKLDQLAVGLSAVAVGEQLPKGAEKWA